MTEDTTPRSPGRPSGSALITPANAALALAKHRAGATYAQLAQDFRCSNSSIIRLLQLARASDAPQNFTLQRTGQAPLEFAGALRVTVSGEKLHTKPGMVNKDFWTITIFDLADGSHVAQIVYHKTHKGIHTEHHTAIVTNDVAQTLRAYDPLSVLQGFPKYDRYAANQAKLENAARLQYDTLVSQALTDAPDEAQPPTPQAEMTPRQIILDLASIAGITSARIDEIRDGCNAERVYRILAAELESVRPGTLTLASPEACSKALDLAIDCALGTLAIDG